MKPPSKKLIDNWKEQQQLVHRMGATVLELMRHPDSTMAEVMDVRNRYAKTYTEHRMMRDRLRKLFRSHGTFFTYPWE
jgi:hypothetical protein